MNTAMLKAVKANMQGKRTYACKKILCSYVLYNSLQFLTVPLSLRVTFRLVMMSASLHTQA